MKGSIVKRSVIIDGCKTSISLEDEFWEALKEISKQDGRSVSQIVAAIEASRRGNRSSAIRLFVLEKARAGHASAPASVEDNTTSDRVAAAC